MKPIVSNWSTSATMAVFFSVLKFCHFCFTPLAFGSTLKWCCMIFGLIPGIVIPSEDILVFSEELLHGAPLFECHPTTNPSHGFWVTWVQGINSIDSFDSTFLSACSSQISPSVVVCSGEGGRTWSSPEVWTTCTMPFFGFNSCTQHSYAKICSP